MCQSVLELIVMLCRFVSSTDRRNVTLGRCSDPLIDPSLNYMLKSFPQQTLYNDNL